MLHEAPEAKRAELIRFRLRELKPLLEEMARNTINGMMKDFRNQLAHCSISYGPYGTVFMEEKSVMRQIAVNCALTGSRKCRKMSGGTKRHT